MTTDSTSDPQGRIRALEFPIVERTAASYEERVEVYTPESIRDIWSGCTAKNNLVLALLEHVEALSQQLSACQQERDELRQALRDVVEHKGCGDPDCCEAAITQEHFRALAEDLLIRQSLPSRP